MSEQLIEIYLIYKECLPGWITQESSKILTGSLATGWDVERDQDTMEFQDTQNTNRPQKILVMFTSDMSKSCQINQLIEWDCMENLRL